MDKDSLGNRMKGYEKVWNTSFTPRLPIIIRIDGKNFSKFTRGFDKPFDETFIGAMNFAANELCESAQGIEIAYLQSDEINILLHNYKRLDSQGWFANEIQKLCSVSASIVASAFTYIIYENYRYSLNYKTPMVAFDARCFILPENEVCNYFIWRQKDFERNSLQMVARCYYSHKELINKNRDNIHDMLNQKGINWDDLSNHLKRGRCIKKVEFERDGTPRHEWRIDNDIPVFTENRNYIEQYLTKHE